MGLPDVQGFGWQDTSGYREVPRMRVWFLIFAMLVAMIKSQCRLVK